MRVAIDGFNLALEKGTGVATYGRNLSYCLRDLGHEVHVLYGKKGAEGGTELIQEVVFFDDNSEDNFEQSKVPVRRQLANMRRAAIASLDPRVRRAGHISLSGAVIYENLRPCLPHFDHLWNSPRFFENAHLRFRLYGGRTKVRIPAAISIMHWTYPLPAQLLGAKNIYTLHDLVPLRLPYTTLDRKNSYFDLVRRLVSAADHIVTVSETSKADIISLLGIPEAKITNTYQTVSIPDDYLAIPPNVLKDELMGTFCLDYKKYFLYYGAIEPKKNVGRIIEAYLGSNLEMPLVVVGGRTWKSEPELKLLKTWTALGANDRSKRKVIQMDYVTFPQLVNLIRGAIAVTFPSLYEGFGLPVLEAMVCETPVITSNIGSMREIAGDAGILVDPYNTRDIKNAMIATAQNAELREGKVSRGKSVAAKFSKEHYLQRLKEAYHRCGTQEMKAAENLGLISNEAPRL